MKLGTSFEAMLRTSGIALLLALVVAGTIRAFSPSDSGQRGFGIGAVAAVCWLYLLWAATAIVSIAVPRRSATKSFWVIFGTNIFIAALILADFLEHR